MRPDIYFYIPVYNEQDTIGVLLYRLGEVMKNLKNSYEVHLTLDGCTDDSAEVVEPYLERMPLRVQHNTARLGYGKCLSDEISRVAGQSRNPKRDYFVILEGDFTSGPEVLQEMAAQIERNTDLYCPNRFHGEQGKKLPTGKRIAHRFTGELLRRRGSDPGEEYDLFCNFKGCRVNMLRRNAEPLKVLERMGPMRDPAVCTLAFFLALFRDARNTSQIDFDVKLVRRRRSRFRMLRTLFYAAFSDDVTDIAEAAARARQEQKSRRGRRGSNTRRKRSSNRQSNRNTSRNRSS